MSTTEQQFEVISDYAGVKGHANYIHVKKGNVIRLIKKDKEWFIVEKDGHIGKVPKRILIQKMNQISSIEMKLPKQTSKQVPIAKQSQITQNKSQTKRPSTAQSSSSSKQSFSTHQQKSNSDSNNYPSNISKLNKINPNPFANAKSSFHQSSSCQIISQTKSINPKDNQYSQIIPPYPKVQIKQQSENKDNSKINSKSQSWSKSKNCEIKQQGYQFKIQSISPLDNQQSQIQSFIQIDKQQSQIQSFIQIDKQQSQITPLHSNAQIKLQSDNQMQTVYEIKSQSESDTTKQEIKQQSTQFIIY